jgi:hypothetical protein
MTKRHIIVGDVHGCIDEFRELLEKAEYDPRKDVGVSLGDIIDRGPDSAGCLELALDQEIIYILANHERKLLRWKQREEAVASGSLDVNDVVLKEAQILTAAQINAHPRGWLYTNAWA